MIPKSCSRSGAPEKLSSPLSYIHPCLPLSSGTEVSSLCQNGGVCLDRGSSYFCRCPPGFQGSICQDRVDPCESRPCQHGATCIAQPSGYLCQVSRPRGEWGGETRAGCTWEKPLGRALMHSSAFPFFTPHSQPIPKSCPFAS